MLFKRLLHWRKRDLASPIYTLSHSMGKRPDGGVGVYNAEVDPWALYVLMHENPTRQEIQHDTLEIFRPPQPSRIARDFPAEVLLRIFEFYRMHVPDEGWDYLPFTVYPIAFSPVPFREWKHLINASSVCALWRSVILTAPYLHPKVIGVKFPSPAADSLRPDSPRDLQRRLRGRANMCKLMLARTAPDLVSLVLIADTSKAELQTGDGRLAVARIIQELTRARDRWKELAVIRRLDDRSLFTLLFWDTDTVDEGAWYRTHPEPRYPGDRPVHEAPSQLRSRSLGRPSQSHRRARSQSMPAHRHIPKASTLKKAPHLKKLSLEIEEVVYDDNDPTAPTASLDPETRYRLALQKRLKIKVSDIETFICDMPDAFPALAHFKLSFHRLPMPLVERVLWTFTTLFPTDLLSEPGHPSGYEEWCKAFLEEKRPVLRHYHEFDAIFHLQVFIGRREGVPRFVDAKAVLVVPLLDDHPPLPPPKPADMKAFYRQSCQLGATMNISQNSQRLSFYL